MAHREVLQTRREHGDKLIAKPKIRQQQAGDTRHACVPNSDENKHANPFPPNNLQINHHQQAGPKTEYRNARSLI
jgi:hypothetical protein